MQHYRTGWLKPLLSIKSALWVTTFFIPLPGSGAKEKTRKCLSVLPFNFFQLLLDFAWVSWGICLRWHTMSVMSLGCRPAVCNERLHFSRWGGSATGHCRKMSTHQTDRPVTVSACHLSITELRRGLSKPGCHSWAAGVFLSCQYWYYLCFLDEINREFDSLAQLSLTLLTSAKFIHYLLLLLIICEELTSCSAF